MKKLTLSQWTSIAEIIGMLAVVVSLIFVGLEIRQNTNQARTEGLETGTDFIKERLKRLNNVMQIKKPC